MFILQIKEWRFGFWYHTDVSPCTLHWLQFHNPVFMQPLCNLHYYSSCWAFIKHRLPRQIKKQCQITGRIWLCNWSLGMKLPAKGLFLTSPDKLPFAFIVNKKKNLSLLGTMIIFFLYVLTNFFLRLPYSLLLFKDPMRSLKSTCCLLSVWNWNHIYVMNILITKYNVL